MQQIELTRGYFTLVDNEDFDWLNQWKWYVVERKGKNLFYAASRRGKSVGNLILMHRLILGITDPKIFGDHKDRDGLNNQRSNLRIATHSQNCTNVKKYKHSSSQYRGVCWHKASNRWMAQIQKDKNSKYLGVYNTELEAAIAYNTASKNIHSEFSNLNILCGS